MKFEIEIDPALLTRDGREFEVQGEYRKAKPGEWWLASDGPFYNEKDCPTVAAYLILRPKRWVPKEGEAVWIVLPSRNEHGDTFVPFKRTFTPEWGTELRQGLVFRDSATAKAAALAEALNSALKKAIGG